MQKENMAYNETLETRVREIVNNWKETEVKHMFGGICHLINGNMFCGVYKDYLILRLGTEKASEAFSNPFVRPFDIIGRPMKGWVMVESGEFDTTETLESWLKKAKEFACNLPNKLNL
ncbi:TfoX/Sxy family protein [Candidatus Latescibacterota bacterium]